MLKEYINMDTLREQADRLKKTRFRAGFDHMTAEAVGIWIEINGEKLLRDLEKNRYIPLPAEGFYTAKADGRYRQIAKLTATDTIIQRCMLEKLEVFCEPFFSPYSFAYRKGRGVSAALQQFCTYGEEFGYAASIDITACFDHIDHSILLQSLQRFNIQDEQIIDLITKYAAMPLLCDGQITKRDCGLLQGAPLSPLLCNVYLDELDHCLQDKNIPFIRYADDIVLFGNTIEEISVSIEYTKKYLEEKLRLKVNAPKSRITSSSSAQYLGYHITRDRKGAIVLQADDTPRGAYYSWYESRMRNDHRTLDILSNGVLRQKDYSLLFDTASEDSNIPQDSIDMINIYSSVVFDSGFLQRALQSNIYINLFDKHGELIGRFTPHTVLKAPIVTFEQLNSYFDEHKRLKLAKEFVLSSLHNCLLNVRYHHKKHPEVIYEMTIGNIKELEKRIKECCSYDLLLLLEAQTRKEYYSCFDHFASSEEFVFDVRTRMPPRNEINAMLSFGNTVLYNRLAFLINKSPLDIRVGYLHSTNGYRKESLHLDVAEIFKPLIVDRVIFSMINLKTIRRYHFKTEENGAVYLTEEGKKVFLRAIYSKFDEVLKVKGRPMTYHMLMEEEVRLLVRHFRKGEKYTAFRQLH